jgi:hypothetical protein
MALVDHGLKISNVNQLAISISMVAAYTSRSLQPPLCLLQRLCFIKAGTSFPVGFEYIISLDMHAQVVVMQEFASRISVVICHCHVCALL